MTRNELIEKIGKISALGIPATNENKEFAEAGQIIFKALRGVVWLHKPQEITLPNGNWGLNCVACDGFGYPCSTIQVIETELNK